MEYTTQNIALIGLAFTVVSSVIGVWRRIDVRVQEVDSRAIERIADITKEISDYKLHVAEKYASADNVEKIEERLNERLDALSHQVSSLPDVVVERIMKFLQIKQQ
jgi:hypothetical protein